MAAAEHQRQVVLSRKQRNTAQEQLPLREFVRALPPGVPIGIEVPNRSRIVAWDRWNAPA